MVPIAVGLLLMAACAGIIYGLHLMQQERERRLTSPIPAPEAGNDEEMAAEKPAMSLANRIQKMMPAAVLESYGQQLTWAGRPYGLDAGQFAILKLVVAVLLPALVPVAMRHVNASTLPLMVGAAVAGLMLPDLWLSARVAQRRRSVQEELPLFTELIATSVSAGLPLTEAVRRVAADAPGLVAQEFLRAVQEMAAGKPRMESWHGLMNRLPGDEFRTIVTSIMQAEQHGTSVAEILRYQVQQIRTFKGAVCNCKILMRPNTYGFGVLRT